MFDRSNRVEFGGCVINLISIEDLILLKLIGMRDKDRVDLEVLLRSPHDSGLIEGELLSFGYEEALDSYRGLHAA